MTRRPLIIAATCTLLLLPFAVVASEPYQWRGAGDLEAALKDCTSWHTTPAHVISTRHIVRFYDERTSKDLDDRCMKRHGLAIDKAIGAPYQNPQYIEFYERTTGIRIKSPAEMAQQEENDRREREARDEAQHIKDEEQLARCASSDATIGDVERCEDIRDRHAHHPRWSEP